MSNQTKNCKHCQSEISKKAKICPVCKKKQKHSILGIILIVFILIAIVGACSNPSTESEYNVASSTTDATDTHTTRTEVTAKPSETPKKLTADKFNAIEFGMTYEEVLDIVGEEGTNISESTIMDYVTAIYQWEEGLNNFNVTFENNIVVGKSQFGVNSITGSNVTLEMYNSIKNGMTYEDVVAVFGSDGALLSTVKTFDTVTTIYMWDGNTLGGNCNVTFIDGEFISKSQYGLE